MYREAIRLKRRQQSLSDVRAERNDIVAIRTVVAARTATAVPASEASGSPEDEHRESSVRSEHGAVGGEAGPGLDRLHSKKEGPTIGYSSVHHRPRSGKDIVDHPVTASDTRPWYQFRAAL